jgi:uncharacterized protein YqgC (DUF456 family)
VLEAFVVFMSSMLVVLGFVGSFLPVLPGPPLTFMGLLLLALVRHFASPLTGTLVIFMGMSTMAVLILDQVIPLLGARRYGASKWGIWGSIAGMVVGCFFSPFAVLFGAFFGAVVAEWLVHRQKGRAFRAGWGVFVGTLFGVVLKLGICGLMTFDVLRALF